MYDGSKMAAARAALKQAATDPGGPHRLFHYENMPVGGRRDLSPAEEEDLQAGRRRWFPRIFKSYSTKPSEMMASPVKGGLMVGLPASLLGAAVGGATRFGPAGAAVGGGAGALAGLLYALKRNARNQDIEELVRRAPPGATRRDILADPDWYANENRPTMSGGRSLLAAVALNNLLR